MVRTTLCLLTFSLLAAPLVISADELTFVSDRDNTLYISKAGELSNGAGMHFFTGVTIRGEPRRGLVHFDLSTIPPGSSIDSAVLTLNMSRTIVGPTMVALHRATADWGEGASDAPGGEGSGATSEPGDATWTHTFFDGQFWATPGGDFVSTPSATTVVDAVGPYSWGSTLEMEVDVSGWVDDPGQNFGWLMMGEEVAFGQKSATAKRFDTREIDEEGPVVAPQLVINFTPPVPVTLQSFDLDAD